MSWGSDHSKNKCFTAGGGIAYEGPYCSTESLLPGLVEYTYVKFH